MDLGDSIKQIRKKVGMSRKEVCDFCKISINALQNIENNKSLPKRHTLYLICRAMNVEQNFVLFNALEDKDIPNDKLEAFNLLKDLFAGIIAVDYEKRFKND